MWDAVTRCFANIIEEGQQIGTMNGQALLGIGIIILGGVVVFLYRSTDKKISTLHEENRRTNAEYLLRIEAKDTSMTAERINRINDLMNRITNDTEVKARLLCAVDQNTKAIEDLKGFLESWIEKAVTRERA